MLVLCYGITKSGSTLAFELVKGMLESAGHTQGRLPDGVVTEGHTVNFVQQVDRGKLDQLVEVAGDRWIAVKTHSGIREQAFPYIERLQRKGFVQAIASYRDPRDICLSLIDAGTHAREHGRKSFSEFSELEGAARGVLRQIVKFRTWGALKGALRLDYDLVAFSPDAAIDRIEQCLGIVCDRDAAKEYAFGDAFTQKNKAIRNRALKELSPAQYANLTKTFSEFIRHGYENDDEAWYNEFRDKIMDVAKPKRTAKVRRKRKQQTMPASEN